MLDRRGASKPGATFEADPEAAGRAGLLGLLQDAIAQFGVMRRRRRTGSASCPTSRRGSRGGPTPARCGSRPSWWPLCSTSPRVTPPSCPLATYGPNARTCCSPSPGRSNSSGPRPPSTGSAPLRRRRPLRRGPRPRQGPPAAVEREQGARPARTTPAGYAVGDRGGDDARRGGRTGRGATEQARPGLARGVRPRHRRSEPPGNTQRVIARAAGARSGDDTRPKSMREVRRTIRAITARAVSSGSAAYPPSAGSKRLSSSPRPAGVRRTASGTRPPPVPARRT